MLRYTLLRVLGAVPTLLLVIALTFLMVHAAPGGPFDDERVLPADVAKNIEIAYHLDEPLPKQFVRYLSGLLQGDLGPSYRLRDFTVSQLIGEAFGVLALAAMLFANLNDFKKLAPCVGPATQMHNIGLLIQVIITGKVITLNVAVVVV